VPEKEEIFQTMYLKGERKIGWVDNRNSFRVISLNLLLNAIQLTHLLPKVKNRFFKYLNLRKA
jgi:hypothetical protein